MTDVITDKRDVKTPDVGVVELDELDQQLVGQLVDRARSLVRVHRQCDEELMSARHPAEALAGLRGAAL